MKRLQYPCIFLIALAFAACETSSPEPETGPKPERSEEGVKQPSASKSEASEVPSEPAPCVPRADGVSSVAVLDIWEETGDIFFCLGSPPDAMGETIESVCLSYDPEQQTYRSGEQREVISEMEDVTIEVKGATVTVCREPGEPSSCEDIAVENIPEGTQVSGKYDAAVNEAGDKLAVIVGPDASRDRFVQIYDVDTGEMSARARVSRESYLCQSPGWLGEALVIHGTVCAGPGGRSWVVDTKSGKRRFDIGGEGHINTYGVEPVRVSGDVWAFVDAFARGVVLQDVETGAVKGSWDLEKYFGEAKGAQREGAAGAVALEDGSLAVVLPDGAAGSVVVIGADGEIKSTGRPEVCPQ